MHLKRCLIFTRHSCLINPFLMNKTFLRLIVATACALFGHSLFAQGTAFTYQGQLGDNGYPATGRYDLLFYLRDALTDGIPVGTTNRLAPVQVENGFFGVTLDFGAGIFTGAPRRLEIGVRTNGGTGGYAILQPRPPLTAAPY